MYLNIVTFFLSLSDFCPPPFFLFSLLAWLQQPCLGLCYFSSLSLSLRFTRGCHDRWISTWSAKYSGWKIRWLFADKQLLNFTILCTKKKNNNKQHWRSEFEQQSQPATAKKTPH